MNTEASAQPQKTVYALLFALGLSHMLNDTLQSLIPAIYPLVKTSLNLNFTQIGLITFCFQLVASLLQPLVGMVTDRRPQPFSLAVGMGFTLIGLVSLSQATSYPWVLVSVALVGIGSSVFHPEASRIVRLAAGERRGLAQSLFQLGGNAGSALGPLLAALIVVPHGQRSIVWFSVLALVAIGVLTRVGLWYRKHHFPVGGPPKVAPSQASHLSPRRTVFTVALLLFLLFSKNFYLAGMNVFFTFFMISKFHVSVQTSQIYLFVFLASVAAGTILGGPIGDRIGRKAVIWTSILGAAPFTLLLPYADQFWTGVLIVPIGLIIASAFPAMVVFAQELVPGKVGLISGLFFGFSFGMAGLGSALLGVFADSTSVEFVYRVTSFLPLIGLAAVFLPKIQKKSRLA